MDTRIGSPVYLSYPVHIAARLLVRFLACLCLAAICALPHVAVAEEPAATGASQGLATEGPSSQEVASPSEPHAPVQQEQTEEQAGGTGGTSGTSGTGEKTGQVDEVRQTGDTVAKPATQPAKTIVASVRLDGPDHTLASVKGITLPEGASAWDATKLALAQSGLSYRLGADSAQDVIASVTDPSGDSALKLDTKTGNGWHLYLNSERYQGSASTAKLQDGDEVVWRYEVPSFEVSVAVVGPGGTGTEYWIAPTPVTVDANQSAWDATFAVFEQNGLAAGRLLSYVVGEDGSVWLESLSGLGESGITGESWQVFLNGAPAETDAAHVALHAGDSVCWYYVGNGVSELPAFVEETGAASPSPVVGIRMDGKVTQAWATPVTSRGSLSEALGLESGLTISGGKLPTVVAHGTSGISSAIQTNTGIAWRQSMANALEKRLYTGQGGRATLAPDGSLYYVDDLGSLVKLEVRAEE